MRFARIAFALLVFTGTASASDIVTVRTAAGDVRVSRSFAPKIQGFIADLVAAGHKPRRVHCFATGGHVPRSRHYSGNACDFNGSANRWPPMNRNRVRHLAVKWGIRDGCSFNDCGHVDDGGLVGVHRSADRKIGIKIRGDRQRPKRTNDIAAIPPYPLDGSTQ